MSFRHPDDALSSAAADQPDPYAPRQPGLPLYTAHALSPRGEPAMVELVDSSTARRRAGQSAAAYTDVAPNAGGDSASSGADDYPPDDAEAGPRRAARRDSAGSRKDGKEDAAWPVSGIGMEGRIPETHKEFLAKGGAERRPRHKVTWVRVALLRRVRRCRISQQRSRHSFLYHSGRNNAH